MSEAEMGTTGLTADQLYLAWGLVHKYVYENQREVSTVGHLRTRITIRKHRCGATTFTSSVYAVKGHRRRLPGQRELEQAVRFTMKHCPLVKRVWGGRRR
jgi:hypothetical protein